MITIYWNEKFQRWLSVKTGGIVEPVKSGMVVDPDLCDINWRLQLRKLGFKDILIPYSEMRKVIK
jgi:hypothetical protein